MIAFAAIPLWLKFNPGGWDVGIYHDAIRSLLRHHDPYADAIAIQDAFHRALKGRPDVWGPFSYIYPPITLPLLEFFGALPVALAGALYWAIYALCALSIIWVGLQAAEPHERRPLMFIAPAALFLPGLLQNDTILSGNVVIIFYGFVLTATVLGWRKGRWRWCYLGILLASCFKLPLLTLLALPLLSARKQFLPAALTAATSLVLFAVQPILWPSLFHHFVEALGHQFAYNRDFGCSPAGLISNLLFDYGISYSLVGTVVYLAYAIPLFGLLYYLSREFLRGRFTLQQWFPVLLVGVILLNPRIMQYDTLTLALPMGLIAWRVLTRFMSPLLTVLILCVVLAGTSLCAVQTLECWRLTEGPLLVVVFAAGCWNLMHPLRAAHAVQAHGSRRRVPLHDGWLPKPLQRNRIAHRLISHRPRMQMVSRVIRRIQPQRVRRILRDLV
jgi:hypothetical protein